ncbi:MAG: hypothetical protein EOP42_17140 [Sphingobacteriaceae bacterium]|nr:MAG: hypothetical protein EOP42_17140 [Sphingobacteriaceae bacterium]
MFTKTKTLFVIISLMFIFLKTGYSQAVWVEEIINKDATKILVSVESFSTEQSKELLVKIFKLNNGFGSAHLPETDETTFNYLITTSVYDEDEAKKVVTIGPFYNPQIIKKTASGNTITFVLQHGIAKNRKNHKLVIGLNKIAYQ